ncbi:hypothetical protein R6Q57_019598 [Mikania cordata]
MSFWDESFFNYSVPDLNEEPPVEYSYGTIDLNAEPNADVGFDSQASYGFVYADDSKQSNPDEGYEEKPAASNSTLASLVANPTLLEAEEIDVIGQMGLVTEEINSKPPEVKKSLIKKVLAQLTRSYITAMDADMTHDDVGQQGPPMDPDTLALSQHEWLQFEAGSAATMRCRCIVRMSMGTPQCIDWGVLGDCGEAERARAILGEDTPWTRLFDLAELPSYRLITLEFLSTFRYRAHQAAVRVDEDAELPPDIEFSLCGQHFETSIERFAVYFGIYYEPETVTDGFAQGLAQGEEGVMRAWWAQISDTPFTGNQVRATMIRDPLIKYIHRQAVQPGTVFRLVLCLLLPPSGAWYTVGWRLHLPHCPDQRHG